MPDESLPQLTKAQIPPQTHILRLNERIATGKALRETTPRQAQAEWKPLSGCRDPVDILIENSKGRTEELLPIRYGRMMASPFAFYRGAAAIMANDLAHTPSTGLTLMVDGDCHLVNFGGFATAERKAIFDLNDFDKARLLPGSGMSNGWLPALWLPGARMGSPQPIAGKQPGWPPGVIASEWPNTPGCHYCRFGTMPSSLTRSSRAWLTKKGTIS